MFNRLYKLFFWKKPFERGSGALPGAPEDYRDISLGSFQKPTGAPASFNGVEGILDQLPYLDQGMQPACVAHAKVKLLMIYIFRKFSRVAFLSPRFVYKLCKLFDGIPLVGGTYARTGALVITKYGACIDELAPNNVNLTKEQYLNFSISPETVTNANQYRMPGFAFVDPTLEAIKEAIFQNGAVSMGVDVGDWSSLPLKPGSTWHQVIAYKYEAMNQDTKIFILNSWGKGWLAWIKNWLFPGRGYFLWSEYKNHVRDIIAFTDIPADLLNIIKKMPYKFTKDLHEGMTDIAVRELQKFLNEDPAIAIGLDGSGSKEEETMYFGPKTKAALTRWQIKNGVPATGYFGAISMRKANERIPKASLIDALIMVESGGDDNAVGDKTLVHKAYGCLQIRQPYMDDVNVALGTSYRAQDCLGNRGLSVKAFSAYMSRYEPNGTDEQKARCHNAGPGWRRNLALTDAYWAKVKRLLNN